MRGYWVVIVLSVLLGCGGISLVVYSVYTHYTATQDMNSLIYKNSDSESTSLDTRSIEVVEEDMNLKVEDLKNCITIPTLDIKTPITEGVTSEALRQGAGHFTDTPKLGEDGNSCYAGHSSTVYNCIFDNLENIKLGDEIVCYDSKGKKYTYITTNNYIVAPQDTQVLDPIEGVKAITIVTCAENGTKRRIVTGRYYTESELARMSEEHKNQLRENFVTVLSNLDEIEVTNKFKGE